MLWRKFCICLLPATHVSDQKKSQKQGFIKLRKLYEPPMFEIQLLFFRAVSPVFTTFNLFLQRDDPQMYILHSQMINLLIKMLSKLIKPTVIQMHKDKLSEVAFNDPENQLKASKLFVLGLSLVRFIKSLKKGILLTVM